MKKTLGKRLISGITSALISLSCVLPSANVFNVGAATDVYPLSGDETKKTDDVTLLIGKESENNDLWASSVDAVIKKADSTYALGIASQFCIFLDGDFHEYQSDAEGRVAVKGNMLLDDQYKSYAIGKGDYNTHYSLEELLGTSGFAHVITQGEILIGQLDDTYFEN